MGLTVTLWVFAFKSLPYFVIWQDRIQGFPGGSEVKNQPTKQEMQVPFLCWEDLMEKETATHSSILACEIPWTEEPGVHGFTKESDTTQQINTIQLFVEFESPGLQP